MSDTKTQPVAAEPTPRPWRQCGKDRGGCVCGMIWSEKADFPVAAVLTKHNESYTLGVGCDRDEANANAALIARAVNSHDAMLDALKLLTQEIEAMHLSPVHDFNALRNGQRFAQARAVIAAATAGGEGGGHGQ